MSKSHRLDPHPTPSGISAGGGVIHDPHQARVKEPDEDYPKMPETSYHHDAHATAAHSPGPFHGDDLVSQNATIDTDTSDSGGLKNTVFFDDVNIVEAKKAHMSVPKPPAVDVRIVEVLDKPTRLTHKVLLPVDYLPGDAKQLLGKDPTRTRALLVLSGAAGDLLVLTPDITAPQFVKANTGQFGWPMTASSAVIEFKSEDEIWAAAASDNTGPVYVSIYTEYVRDVFTREEYFNG